METKNALLIFNKQIMYKPIIYKLVTDYNILFNVLEAKILPKQEGRLILQLEGKTEDVYESLSNYLEMFAAINLAVSQKIRKSRKTRFC